MSISRSSDFDIQIDDTIRYIEYCNFDVSLVYCIYGDSVKHRYFPGVNKNREFLCDKIVINEVCHVFWDNCVTEYKLIMQQLQILLHNVYYHLRLKIQLHKVRKFAKVAENAATVN